MTRQLRTPGPVDLRNVAAASDWTATITKAADESVTSTVNVQDDNELQFTAANGVVYLIEIFALYTDASNGTADFNFACGEDTTLRGAFVATYMNNNPQSGFDVMAAKADQAGTQLVAAGSTGVRAVVIRGYHVGAGATFRFQWAQNTSNGSAVTVKAGSYLRYRAFT